jgi:hypothetical protein
MKQSIISLLMFEWVTPTAESREFNFEVERRVLDRLESGKYLVETVKINNFFAEMQRTGSFDHDLRAPLIGISGSN